jgi:predicted DNA-binding ArsR family transcriptional regulator
MADKAAMISYTWLTKQQLEATNGRQSSNDQLHMADKAGISRNTWPKKQK